MNRDKLLNILNTDIEIQDAIKKLVSNDSNVENNDLMKLEEEIDMLKNLVEKWKKCFRDEALKSSNLSQEIKHKDSQTSILKSDMENLNQSKKDIQTKMEKMEISNNALNDEIEFYKKNFSNELETYKLYTRLSNETKSSLKGIFKDDSMSGFLVCGVQENNINSFWDYIKNEIIEDNNSDIEKLVLIFTFLFDKFMMAYPIYKIQNVNIGDEFDALEQIKYSNALVSGKISEVLLKGWINTKTSNIIRKSVVKIS